MMTNTPPLTPLTASRDNPTPIDALGERIAELAARIHAATYEFLTMLREYDEGKGWNNGFLSCAHWLNWRTGIDLGAAREKVRVARALPGLPLIGDAMRRGRISYARFARSRASRRRRPSTSCWTSSSPARPRTWSASCGRGGVSIA